MGGTAITDYELFSILMDNLTDCIYFKDVESRFVRINRVMAERFGLTHPEEAIGKSDFDYFSPEHARQAYLDEQQVITTGSPIVHKEVKEIWPDNREYWVSITKYPWKDTNGDIVGTFGISWDITERKQTEIALARSEQKLRTIFEAARDGIIVADINGNVIEANSAATQLVGQTIKDIIGANAVQFIHEKDRQKHCHENPAPTGRGKTET